MQRANATGLARSSSSTGCGGCRAAGILGEVFEEAGFTALTPGWPDDPETVEEANAHPEVFAHKTVGQVVDHYDEIIRGLSKKPAVIGHSSGGLFAQISAGRPGRIVGVHRPGSLPRRAATATLGAEVLATGPGQPGQPQPGRPTHVRVVPVRLCQRRSEKKAKELYETFAVPAAGEPLFQAAAANLNPWTALKVDSKNPDRGPLLIISGAKDNIVPCAIANASYKKQKHNEA